MSTAVLYKSKYGSTKAYADWIAEQLGCTAENAKNVHAKDLTAFDTIIYGGGIYAETINGVSLLAKNIEVLAGKKLIVYTTGITPVSYRDYYDNLVIAKNFKNGVAQNIKIFNFPGKMIISELTAVHRTAINSLKKIMQKKQNPTSAEKLLLSLCDADGDFTDLSLTSELIDYVQK